MPFGLVSIATVLGEHEVGVEELAAAHGATPTAVRHSVEGLHVFRSERSSLELGVAAANLCLERAQLTPDAVDCVLWCGGAPESASGRMVQEELKIKNAFAFSLLAGCSALPIALHSARGLVADGTVRNVLVVYGERWPSRLMPLDFMGTDQFSETERTYVFSDSGGAALVGTTECLRLEGFGFANVTENPKPESNRLLVAWEELPMQRLAIERCLTAAGITVDELDHVLLTNIAPDVRRSWMNRFRLPQELLHTRETMPSHLGNGDGLYALESLTEGPPARILLCALSLGAMRCALIRR